MFGIYIHFPYCIHKCSYCDFFSVENLNTRNRFADSLCSEIEIKSKEYGGKIPADTLFFGGGTPSLMKEHHIRKVFAALNEYIDFAPNTEMTMECNPGAIDVKYMSVYRELGINRISFGVQSFIERDLEFLERIHSIDDVYNAIKTARDIGFDNISIDLMFALPNHTLQDWRYNLERAIELETQHISAYSLIYEPGTPLYKDYISGKIKAQDEDFDSELYYLTDELLQGAGFHQYEISNYAKDGYECKHNLKYWGAGEYFGFGPSAHSYVNGVRAWNFRSNEKYFLYLKNGKIPQEDFETLTEQQKAFEYIYLSLRAKGLDLEDFEKRYKIDMLKSNEKYINLLENNNLIYLKNNILRLTNKGYFVSDDITIELSKIIDEL